MPEEVLLYKHLDCSLPQIKTEGTPWSAFCRRKDIVFYNTSLIQVA